MTLPALANAADVEVRVGRAFTPEELARATAILRDVSAVIRMEAGSDFVDEDDELAVPDAVRAVALLVARRAFMNPRGVTSNQIGGYSERVHSDEAMGIFLAPVEKRMLRNAMGRATSGTIAVPQAYRYVDTTVWAYPSQGFDPIPMEEL